VGRLWNASSPSTYGWRNYTYDGFGNILRMNRSMNGARNDLSDTYDIGGEGGNFGTYRLMSVSSSASGTIRSYTYDARGQPTTIYNPAHGSATYYYEQDGLLVKNSAGSSIKCRYDAFSRRVYVDDVADSFDRTKLHVFTGNSVVYDPEEKMTPKTHQTCYVYADGLFIGKVYGPSSKPSQYKAYVNLDHLGSVRVITGEEGTAQFSARYEPYGKL
jgi:YD repeat-containing protein